MGLAPHMDIAPDAAPGCDIHGGGVDDLEGAVPRERACVSRRIPI